MVNIPKVPVGLVAATVERAGKIVEVVEASSSRRQERAREVRQPQRAEDVDERFAGIPGDVHFRNEQRRLGRQPIVAPDLEDV